MSTLGSTDRPRGARSLWALPLGLTLLLAPAAAGAAQEGHRAAAPSAGERSAPRGDSGGRGGDRGGSGMSAVSRGGPDVSAHSGDPAPARHGDGGGVVNASDDHGGGGGHHGGSGHHGGGGYHGGRGYHGGYHGYGHGGYGYGGWSVFFGWPYYPYYYPYPYDYPYPYPYRYVRYADRQGALDLDVNPGNTEVYLDGQFVGKVDAYDGWPEYLWLDEGTYDVAFYLPGYKTNARQITVRRGLVIDVDFKMEPGDAVRPEDLPSATHERRDARLRQDEEMRRRAERGERPGDRSGDEDWRDRVRDRRADEGDVDEPMPERPEGEDIADAPDAPDTVEGTLDARGEPGKVRLEVEPDDASVYLDGRFIGTGEEIAKLHEGLLVDPGEHRLSVVRPGRRGAERTFTARAGEEVRVEVRLDRESP